MINHAQPFARKCIQFLTILLIVALLPICGAMAQDGDDDDLPEDPDTNVPIDGGLTFLLAAGAVAGARKVYQEKKKRQQGSGL